MAAASISTTAALSSRFTYSLLSPAATPNSGPPPRSIVPIARPDAGSITLAECASPLNVKIRRVAGSYRIASSSGAIEPRDLRRDLPGARIDHHHAVLPRDKQPMADGVQRDVVPAAVAAEHEGVSDVIPRRPCGAGAQTQQRGAAREDTERNAHEGSLGNGSDNNGKLMVTRVPRPGVEPISIRAPWASAIHRAMASPRPAPSAWWRDGSPR